MIRSHGGWAFEIPSKNNPAPIVFVHEEERVAICQGVTMGVVFARPTAPNVFVLFCVSLRIPPENHRKATDKVVVRME